MVPKNAERIELCRYISIFLETTVKFQFFSSPCFLLNFLVFRFFSSTSLFGEACSTKLIGLAALKSVVIRIRRSGFPYSKPYKKLNP